MRAADVGVRCVASSLRKQGCPTIDHVWGVRLLRKFTFCDGACSKFSTKNDLRDQYKSLSSNIISYIF